MIDLGIGNLRIKKAGRSGIYALFKGEDLVTPLSNLEEHLAAMVEKLEQRLAEARRQLLMSNALPRITDEIYNDYVGEAFIEIENGKPDWTQAAIDFAALLDEMKGKINESVGDL